MITIIIVILALADIIAAFILLLMIATYKRKADFPMWRWIRWGIALGLGAGIILLGILWLPTESPAPPNTNPTLADLLAQAKVTTPQHLPSASEAKIELGEALFWDPLLSGNKDTACATCHHPQRATGDGLSLSIGTGGQGLAPNRTFVSKRQALAPRNATSIYNLGLAGMDVLFWDGRVQSADKTGFVSPANEALPAGLDNAVAVQAMFPVTSRHEMRGRFGEKDIFGMRNELGSISDYNFPDIWDGLMARILTLPTYQQLFMAAYPDTPLDELGFEHAANAIAAYQMNTFTFLDSPWDRYLQGDEKALSAEALQGARLFYGEAGCARCHSGPLLSDMQFHNIGVPQAGPGKGAEAPLDYGRARETGDDSDLFAFRTPPLRNVAITGPWMHNGVYLTLEEAVRHHINPVQAVADCDYGALSPLMQKEDSGNPDVHAAALTAPSFVVPATDLSDDQILALLAFLEALTSPSAADLSHTIPESVPSSLPVGGNIQ